MEPLVSVIVPVYNVEKYLKECLDSVVKQSLKNIEIICVDDGSTDNSLKIIKKYAAKDKRVIPISKKNSGYGNTMNVGILNAKGRYIGIVESDDYVDTKMFEHLYGVAKDYNLDLIKSDYKTFTTKKGRKACQYQSICPTIDKYNIVTSAHNDKSVFNYKMNTWTGIYRRAFILENKIFHNETPGASYQDNGFWFQTIALAKAMMFVNRAFYYYRQDNPNSSINSKGKIFCMCDEYQYIADFIENNGVVKQEFYQEYFVKKFFNYYYTFERVSEEYKLIFLKRFAFDMESEINKGNINIDCLDEWVRNIVFRIVKNYETFYYEDRIYKLEKEIEEQKEILNIIRGSEEIKNGMKIKKFLGKN